MSVTTTTTAQAIRVAGSLLPPPVLLMHDDGPANGRWELHEPYSYRDEPHDCTLHIPAGFRFDLASVPRPLWGLIAPFDLSIVAPLLHDALYRHGGVLPDGWCVAPRKYSRKEADELLRDVAKKEGVSGWRAEAAYVAVRLFGRGSWKA